MASKTVRNPAVAGMFYPAEPARLRATVEQYLQSAESRGSVPKAIIVPHAGYVYSGPIAASAYTRLATAADIIKRVVLLGPAHRVSFRGLALPSCQSFMTPLGAVPVDQEAVANITHLPQVLVMDDAHIAEHSLEVHLPFLQTVLSEFTLVPLAVGQVSAVEVGEVLECLWGGAETLIVISSDLSHYYDYETARRMDTTTSQAIEQLRPEDIGYEQACGRIPINGLLYIARKRGMHAKTIDLRNSGDTAGSRDQVVGYGAYVFE
jgi:AmmeMemoRadiSam system protein B